MVPTLMDGPHVGVGRGMGLLRADNVCEFEVQCCYVGPGSQRFIKTGNLSVTSKEAVESVSARVVSDIPRIAEVLGLPKANLRLLKPRLDLHVHVSHKWNPIEGSYLMGPIYVAMVALMAGGRSRGDTLVFGNIDERGVLVGESWALTEQMVKFAAWLGYRRLVAGRGLRINSTARVAADEQIEVNAATAKRMELIICDDHCTLVDLLPECFE